MDPKKNVFLDPNIILIALFLQYFTDVLTLEWYTSSVISYINAHIIHLKEGGHFVDKTALNENQFKNQF